MIWSASDRHRQLAQRVRVCAIPPVEERLDHARLHSRLLRNAAHEQVGGVDERADPSCAGVEGVQKSGAAGSPT
jgi:hypothetical protein